MACGVLARALRELSAFKTNGNVNERLATDSVFDLREKFFSTARITNRKLARGDNVCYMAGENVFVYEGGFEVFFFLF